MHLLTNELLSLLERPEPIAILSHMNPDGDGFCASLFLTGWLKFKGKEAHIITDGDDLSRFAHLMDEDIILNYHEDMFYDSMVVLDCNSSKRLGARAALLNKVNKLILVDHHEVENDPIQADYCFIDQSYVSVGAILFEAMEAQLSLLPSELQHRLAACLYTSIINDTNNFTNGNTSSIALGQASRIAAYGVQPSYLYRSYFQDQPPNEIRYIGEVLSTVETHFEGKLLVLHSSYTVAQRNQINPADILNVTRWVQGVRGIQAIIFIREDEPGDLKLSFRSAKVDVSSFAARFGGGGHRNA